jgi:Beige/BEACH domain
MGLLQQGQERCQRADCKYTLILLNRHQTPLILFLTTALPSSQPELFCCPETLINTSSLPLGELQEGRGVVDDVLLPPWAQADAFEFVRLHREALESDYVSEVRTRCKGREWHLIKRL